MSDEPSFAVVIPAFNEEAGIATCISEVTQVLATLPNRTSLIVVDDGSADATPALLDNAAISTPLLRAVHHEWNRGYGAALRTGIVEAAEQGMEYCVFMDSDLTNDPSDLPKFAAQMKEGTDVIKASRYVQGGGAEGVPAWRVAFSVAGNTVARFLLRLPIRDCTNGFRAVRTRLLLDLELEESGFAIIMEELYRLKPSAESYAEIPVRLTNRREGLRPSVFSYTPRSLFAFLRYPLRSSWEATVSRLRKERS